MPLMLLPLIGLVFMAGGLLFVAFGLRSALVTEDALRLLEYVDKPMVQAPERIPALSFRKAELAGSFRTRVLLPWFQRLGRLFGRLTPARAVDDLRRQLAIAGTPLGLGPREFYGIRFLFALTTIALAFVILRGGITPAASSAGRQSVVSASLPGGQTSSRPRISFSGLAGSAVALYLGTYMPKIWLRRRVRGRQNKIRKALPDALDMLSVCADAGLGFDQGLQRVSEHWNTPLTQEFSRVVAEMQMGVTRQTALRNLADRVDVAELSSFVAVIVQSDQLGMSIVNTLHSQAAQMREERRFRAQEEARKAPLKMLFPMLFLILPAMFAVIIGPSVPAFADFFSNLRGALGP